MTDPVEIEFLHPPVSHQDLSALHGLMEILTERSINLEEVTARLEKMLMPPETERVLVARVAGNIVGTATLTRKQLMEENTGYIDSVVVHPDFERRGIASGLMDVLTHIADSEEMTLQLTSNSRRTGALTLYAAWRFRHKDTNFMVRRPNE